MLEKLKSWEHVVLILGGLALAVVAGIFVPGETWDKVGRLAAKVAEEPAAVIALAGVMGSAVAAYRRARALPPPSRPSVPPLPVLFMLLIGCGASPAVRSAYALEQARCNANERAIIERSDTTEAQDRADWALERARCDAALLAIGGAP